MDTNIEQITCTLVHYFMQNSITSKQEAPDGPLFYNPMVMYVHIIQPLRALSCCCIFACQITSYLGNTQYSCYTFQLASSSASLNYSACNIEELSEPGDKASLVNWTLQRMRSYLEHCLVLVTCGEIGSSCLPSAATT